MSSPGPTFSLTALERLTVSSRLRVRIRRALSEGALLFLVSTLFALGAAAALRAYLVSHEEYANSVKTTFTRVFLRKQEFRPELEFPGMMAADLALVPEPREDSICDPNASDECRIGLGILDSASALYGVFDSGHPMPIGIRNSNRQASSCGLALPQTDEDRLDGIYRRSGIEASTACALVRHANAVVVALRSPTLSNSSTDPVPPCPRPDTNSGAAFYSLRAGVAGCVEAESVPGLVTLVPAQLSQGAGTDMRDLSPGYSSRVRRALSISHILDPSVARAAIELESVRRAPARERPNASSPAVDFVQAYFISLDSVLRIWSPTDREPLKSLSRTRLWAASSYFVDFLKKDTDKTYLSRPYLDSGGHGIVRTACKPLLSRKITPPRMDGIICADFGLTLLDQLVEMRKLPSLSAPFLHIARVKLTLQPDPPRASVTWLTPASETFADKSTLEEAIRNKVSPLPADDLMGQPRELEIHRTAGFLVPFQENRDGTLDFLATFPRDPRDTDTSATYLIAFFVLAGLWLAFVVGNGFGAYRDRQTRTRIALFRSLQAGIFETRGVTPEIIRANDRAEELLERKLPKEYQGPMISGGDAAFRKLGARFMRWLSSTNVEKTYVFWDLVKIACQLRGETAFPIVSPTNAVDASGASKYVELQAGEIRRLRRGGGTTRYWMLLAPKDPSRSKENKWLEVVAGPYVRMDGWRSDDPDGEPELATYGVLEPAGPLLSKDLDDWYRDYQHPKATRAQS